MSEPKHNHKGNCWDDARSEDGELLDVCMEHEEPRGDCEVCPRCETCDKEDDPQGTQGATEGVDDD